MRALVATEHSMAKAIWHMLTQGVPYLDLGGDYYTRRDPERTKARITAQAEALGYSVTFTPVEAAETA
jgi:N-formylglutamate amidohydrolase